MQSLCCCGCALTGTTSHLNMLSLLLYGTWYISWSNEGHKNILASMRWAAECLLHVRVMSSRMIPLYHVLSRRRLLLFVISWEKLFWCCLPHHLNCSSYKQQQYCFFNSNNLVFVAMHFCSLVVSGLPYLYARRAVFSKVHRYKIKSIGPLVRKQTQTFKKSVQSGSSIYRPKFVQRQINVHAVL